MQTTFSGRTTPLDLPFVGRDKLVARLGELHARRRHALIVGPAGAGKSALIRHVSFRLRLLVCPDTVRLSAVCDAFEEQLGLEAAGEGLVRRKNRVLAALAGAGQTVVFDGVGRAGPRVCSFVESVCRRVPVWVCTRSEHPWDIGHLWPTVARFERVEIGPLGLRETRALIEAAVGFGMIPAAARPFEVRLHRLAGGNVGKLCGLLACLAGRHYDLASARGLRLLDLDRRMGLLTARLSLERTEP